MRTSKTIADLDLSYLQISQNFYWQIDTIQWTGAYAKEGVVFVVVNLMVEVCVTSVQKQVGSYVWTL